jgi:hypothetical protein
MIHIKHMSNRDDFFISYPNGEFGINLKCIADCYLSNNNKLEFTVDFNNSYYCEDILKLNMILSRLLNSESIYAYTDEWEDHFINIKPQEIFIKFNYLPFSREDREENNRLCTFEYIKDLLYLETINWSVDDLHSNKIIKSPVNIGLFPIKDYDVIIFPDKGSYEKYGPYIDKDNKYFIACNKKRDKDTGKLIESVMIYTNIQVEKTSSNLKCLIIDDICSYGNTFKMIPKNDQWTYDLYTIYNEGLVDSIDGIRHVFYKHNINFKRK